MTTPYNLGTRKQEPVHNGARMACPNFAEQFDRLPAGSTTPALPPPAAEYGRMQRPQA
jgi:hypothetical protein